MEKTKQINTISNKVIKILKYNILNKLHYMKYLNNDIMLLNNATCVKERWREEKYLFKRQ
jgi:hypothetical protein